jgi:hypothetical protein
MAIYDFFLSRNNAATTTPENYVGHTGRLFYESTTGEIKISDGTTLGGVAIPITVATPTIAGGIKLGAGVILNNDDQIIIDSNGLDFSFGDFQATSPTINGSSKSLLSSINVNEDILIATNGSGNVEVVGNFHVHATNGTLAGSLSYEEIFKVDTEGKIRMLVPLADEVAGALEIIGNAGAEYHPPNQTGVILHVTGQTDGIARHYLDANNNYPIIVGRRYNGTYDAPTPVLNGEVIFRLVGQASTDGQFETRGPARMEMRATQDQATGAQGGEIAYYVTPLDTAATSAIQVMKFNAETGITTVDINPQVTGTYDLGSTGLRWRNVYTDTMNLVGNTLTTVNPATDIVIGDTDSVGVTDMTNRAVEITDLTVTNPIVGNGSQLTNLPTPTLLSAVASADTVIANSRVDPAILTNMTLSPAAGTYLATFSSEYISTLIGSVTSTAAADLATLYAELMALTATVTGHTPAYGSETLGPGVYTQAAASSIAGTLTLDAGGNADALFVFRCAGALTTGASATIVLTNGATSNNVWFVSQGAISTGTNAVIRGSLISNQSANNPGSGTSIEGRLLTINGAIGLNNTTITAGTGTINAALTFGSIVLFSAFAGIGALTNTGASNLALDIGTDSGTISGFGAATVDGDTYAAGSPSLGVISYGIYVDGVLIADSNRTQTQTSLVSGWPMSIQSIATVTAGQTIDVRTTVPTGGFSIGPGMTLTLMPITT